ncbi:MULTISPECIES: hypothetical protein [Capnocytophaga]|uniref:VWFA domain-containing protein n=1 Tax=Capnocytophaga canis TaxID=1848903 RepID=A0A0B7IFX1_9FLAO|nr:MULTISPECIES: hypothetical protein [Capnocytophaga]ATA75163.1 hypothetical protein CGC52_06880 [Capnocytophaga sp. H2931]CEN49544.1 conserved exported hypothetical protein [Capnocytophaga canis]
MKKVISIIAIIAIIAIGFSLSNCNFGNAKKQQNEEKTKEQQYNITLLLDLSDRIDPSVSPNTPEHYQRDIEIIKNISAFFKKDMEKKGAYKAKGRMRVIFSPPPTNPEINQMVNELNIDLSKFSYQQTAEKKNIYDNILETYATNLEKAYQQTIQTSNYIGSDIWRFFKNDVKDYCVASEDHYRNILVILTDGYLYHSQSKDVQKNRSAFLSPTSIQSNGLRSANWREKFDTGDFGFITTRNDLQDLEVLVLEITPSKKAIQDEDVIKAYLEKWFKEMNVKRFAIYNTDLPSNTQSRIDKFLTQE